MKNVVAFVQARMGSSRLPGKVMKRLNNMSVVEHLVYRINKSQFIDDVVVLTSTAQENDEFESHLIERNIKVFRGSEEDVLGRFAQALSYHPARYIVRLTGDSPFIDWHICDDLIDKVINGRYDYGYLSERFAEGVDCEVVRSDILRTLNHQTLRPSEREHVTLHLYENSENNYYVFELTNERDDASFRFTLDNEEDWQVVKAIAESQTNSQDLTYEQIKTFLIAHPEVVALNSHIQRNEGLALSIEKEGSHE